MVIETHNFKTFPLLYVYQTPQLKNIVVPAMDPPHTILPTHGMEFSFLWRGGGVV